MTLAFLCAYACPAIALRQTVHAGIDIATRKRRLSDGGKTDGDTVMTADGKTPEEPSRQGEPTAKRQRL